LDCAACAACPATQRFLGCGAPPQIEAETLHGVETVDMTPAWWRATRDAGDLAESERSVFWAFAQWGDTKLTEWWTCPRWYDEFAEPYASELADEAIQLAWWLDVGCLEAVARLPLTREQERYARLAYSLFEEQRAARLKPKERDGE
jgi:hypothetical protein